MSRTTVSTPGAPVSEHYAQATRAGNLLFVSGQLPRTPAGELVAGSFEEQARQAFTNVRAIVEAAGATLDDVVRVGVYLRDIGNWDRMNAVYHEFFRPPLPARSTIQTALPGFEIEVDAVVEVPSRSGAGRASSA